MSRKLAALPDLSVWWKKSLILLAAIDEHSGSNIKAEHMRNEQWIFCFIIKLQQIAIYQ